MTTDFFNETLPPTWFALCPDLSKMQQLIFTTNVTRSRVQQALFGCFYAKIVAIIALYSNLEVYVPLTIACFGLLGSALITITLFKTKSVYFQAPTYRYFRVLVLVQFLNMLATIHGSARVMTGNADQRYYAWYFVTVYIEPMLSFVCTSWTDLIILYLSVERAVACLLPAHFYKLIGKKCFGLVILSTFLIAFSSEILVESVHVIVYNRQQNVYTTETPNAFADSIGQKYRSAFMIGKCAFLVLSTSAAVVGFYSAYKKKKNLKHNLSTNQQSQTEWKVTAQLCVLQLAQAVPTILSSTSAVVFLLGQKQPASWSLDVYNLTFANDEQLSETFFNYHSFFSLVVFFGCTTIFGHSIHFYLYFACSRPFRAEALNAIVGAILPCFKIKFASSTINQHQLPQALRSGVFRSGQTVSTGRNGNPPSAWTEPCSGVQSRSRQP